MFDGILFVVYRNGIGVMNIQLAEEYKNGEKGEKERGFRVSRSRGPREEGCSKEYEHEEEEGLKRT